MQRVRTLLDHGNGVIGLPLRGTTLGPLVPLGVELNVGTGGKLLASQVCGPPADGWFVIRYREGGAPTQWEREIATRIWRGSYKAPLLGVVVYSDTGAHILYGREPPAY